MPRYKRTHDEAELDLPSEPAVAPEDAETLIKLRNMWEFASLMQYIFLFGSAVKIDDDIEIEDLEKECLRPLPSDVLAAIGLALLKIVSSHRGLTPAIFSEYTRRQFVAKAPQRNPFGEDEEPKDFNALDVFTKIRVLQQLSTWTFGNVDRLRGLMPDTENHLDWRMDPLGWDQEGRTYYALDDNRLYRRTDEVPPPPTPEIRPKAKPKSKGKAKTTKKSKGKATRSSKRQKVEVESEEEPEEPEADAEPGAQDDTIMTNGDSLLPPADEVEEIGYGITSRTWECVAVTLEEYQDFMATIFRSRDPNEKALRKEIEAEILPLLEKRAEAARQKQLKKLRELENVQLLATAKRSSRLAGKQEKEKEERDKREAEEKRLRDIKMAHNEEDRQRRVEEGHESRRLTREQRIKEREVKRILHEEELTRLQSEEARAVSQDPNNLTSVATDSESTNKHRISSRQVSTQLQQHKQQLAELAAADGKWYFDCSVCGMHGENLDDGTHSLACDRCEVWQHSKCHGFTPAQAEADGFTFVCQSCTRKEADAGKPKIKPLKLGKKTSASPETAKNGVSSAGRRSSSTNGGQPHILPPHVQRQLDGAPLQHSRPSPSPGPFGQITNGPSLSPQGQLHGPPGGYRYPPVANFAPAPPQQAWTGTPLPPPPRPSSSGYASSPPQGAAAGTNGYGGTTPHQQQHLYQHQSAVAQAGGHPGYRVPPPQQANGYGSTAPHYPQQQYSQQQYQQYPPQRYQQPPQYQQPQFQQPQAVGIPIKKGVEANGVPSPTKPRSSPPQQRQPQQNMAPSSTQQPPAQTHPAQSPAQWQHHQSPSLQQSPHASFPPPTNPYPQHAGHSPVKSSPPAHLAARPTYQQPPIQASPHLAQTPQPLRPTNGHAANASAFRTPVGNTQNGGSVAPAGQAANGTEVAADGMSGPWPSGSQGIPQKHDQSPAAPASSQKVGAVGVLPPPGVGFTPSPTQAVGIPVKKGVEGGVEVDGHARERRASIVNAPALLPVVVEEAVLPPPPSAPEG